MRLPMEGANQPGLLSAADLVGRGKVVQSFSPFEERPTQELVVFSIREEENEQRAFISERAK